MYKTLYNSLNIYFNALSKLGHVSYDQVERLIVLVFITNLIYRDYRGNIKREDYHTFEQALNNLFGSTCLIPFTDYYKMGRLHIGEMRELLNKINETAKAIKETESHLEINDSVTVAFVDRIKDAEQRIGIAENDITQNAEDIKQNRQRIEALEDTQ